MNILNTTPQKDNPTALQDKTQPQEKVNNTKQETK